MKLEIIAALDNQYGIGKDGSLPWKLPKDLERFKSLTLDNTVIMGRKTWESLPIKPLPDRENIVISKDLTIPEDSTIVTIASDIESALQYAEVIDKKTYIIGGSEIYAQLIDQCEYLHITHIAKNFKCDKFFPLIKDKFSIVSCSGVHKEGKIEYYFATYLNRDLHG